VHSSLGVSPAQILFANAIDLDRNLFPNAKEFSISYANLTLSQYATDLIAAQDIIIKVAQEHQLAKDEKHLQMQQKYMQHKKFREHQESQQPQSLSRRKRKRIDDNTADANPEPPIPTVFPVNSFVLVAYPENGFTKRARPPNKLMPEWKGPYQVISFIGANYTVLNLVTMKEEPGIHVKRLKQFEYVEGTDPRDIANKATDSWDVEEILSHTGSSKQRNQMTFLVKWLGYEEPTSEPYSNRSLFKTAAMHKYLRDNKLITLIPAAYKN